MKTLEIKHSSENGYQQVSLDIKWSIKIGRFWDPKAIFWDPKSFLVSFHSPFALPQFIRYLEICFLIMVKTQLRKMLNPLELHTWITDKILPHVCQTESLAPAILCCPWNQGQTLSLNSLSPSSEDSSSRVHWNKPSSRTRPIYLISLECTTRNFIPSHLPSILPHHTCSLCLQSLFSSSSHPTHTLQTSTTVLQLLRSPS